MHAYIYNSPHRMLQFLKNLHSNLMNTSECVSICHANSEIRCVTQLLLTFLQLENEWNEHIFGKHSAVWTCFEYCRIIQIIRNAKLYALCFMFIEFMLLSSSNKEPEQMPFLSNSKQDICPEWIMICVSSFRLNHSHIWCIEMIKRFIGAHGSQLDHSAQNDVCRCSILMSVRLALYSATTSKSRSALQSQRIFCCSCSLFISHKLNTSFIPLCTLLIPTQLP